MAWDDLDKDRIEQIIRQISGKGLKKSTELVSPAKIVTGKLRIMMSEYI